MTQFEERDVGKVEGKFRQSEFCFMDLGICRFISSRYLVMDIQKLTDQFYIKI